ncbi:MAG: PKD domain-containing protein [Nanoarchaeota archaeon]
MKKLTISLIFIFILFAGFASASTEFYIFGSFDELPIVIKDADLYRDDTINYSFYAKSYHGPFIADTYLSTADCSLSQVEYPLVTARPSSPAMQHGTPIDEAGLNAEPLVGSDFAPGSYNLCMESYQSGSSRHDSYSITLDVINNPPYFNGLISPHIVNEHTAGIALQNLSDASFDDDGDTLSYSLDTSMTDPNVASCHLSSTPQRTLICDSNNSGTTSVSVTISDGYDSTTQPVSIIVNATNDQPFFTNLPLNYTYNVTGGLSVDVVDIANHAHDPDNDPLSYSLDTSMTDSSLASCYLDQSSIIHCDFPGKAGTTTLDVTVSDGSLSSTQTITLYLFNDTYASHPTAIISGPSLVKAGEQVTYDGLSSHGSKNSSIDSYDWSIAGQAAQGHTIQTTFASWGSYTISLTVTDTNGNQDTTSKTVEVRDNATVSIVGPSTAYPGETVTYDGSGSSAPAGLSIVDYEWTLKTESGTVLDTLHGDSINYQFTATGTYLVTLTVTDSMGQKTSKTVVLVVKEKDIQLSDYDPEQGLKMMSYDVYGTAFETARVGERFTVEVDVKNVAGEDLDDIRLIYTIPEIGVKFKSHAIDLDTDQRRTITIHEHIPYYLEPGIYYPRITLSDDEIRRVKYGYLEVIE